MLCAQIQFGDCITKIPLGLGLPNFGIVAEPPFGIDDLFNIPLGIDVNNLKGSIHPKGPRFDFAFKKAVIRKIQQTMIAAVSSPFRHMPGEVGYLQSRHFQKRLLKVLPAKVLDRPIRELGFVDQEIKDKLNVSLRELLSIPDGASAGEAGISLKESRDLRTKLFRSRLQN